VLVGTTVLAALPAFVASTFLISTFSVGLGWFPAFGSGDGLFDQLKHLTLPAVALAGASMALVARVTRTSVRAEMGREHVQTAVSRGIPRATIVRRHVLRNAAIPITTVAGVTVASLIALAAVVERAFSLNGLGSYLVSAAASKDFAVVQGISLVLVTVFVVINTLVDLAYAFLDPRVELGERAK
jgi:peptide/nickel transport system permease protein